MTQSDWLRLAGLALALLLILPGILRLPGAIGGRRLLLFIAAWLGIFLLVGLAYSFFAG
ncbi:hypothetical protein [Ferrovibrio sp.]|jgi:hypothetical protein|uniref:hypothetical protein n=1 Tax=Ferrovibrio sp. TaxID=1917215 RepID=UPI0035ADDCF7